MDKIKQPTWDTIDSAYRWTGDFVKVNSNVEPIIAPMPDLTTVTGLAAGAGFFQSFDLHKGFWQIPLHPDCQEYYSFITEDGVFSPTRLIQGATDSALFFQATMQRIFSERYNRSLLIWIDDTLSFAKTFEELLDNMEYVLEKCEEYCLKLNAKKVCFFQTEAKFCGKILTAQGIKHDPTRTEALSQMAPPSTVGELQQFLCAMNWLKTSLPDASRIAQPLRDRLEAELTALGKRTKRATKNIQLTLTDSELTVFTKLKLSIKSAVELAHPDPNAQLVLTTDASQEGWASVLFQIPDYDPRIRNTV